MSLPLIPIICLKVSHTIWGRTSAENPRAKLLEKAPRLTNNVGKSFFIIFKLDHLICCWNCWENTCERTGCSISRAVITLLLSYCFENTRTLDLNYVKLDHYCVWSFEVQAFRNCLSLDLNFFFLPDQNTRIWSFTLDFCRKKINPRSFLWTL